MSQKEVAEKAGIDRVTYGRHERGTQKPLPLTLQSIADALAVEVEDIDFPQWLENYINKLEIPSEIKGNNGNQFETEDGSLLDENGIEAEVIEITDSRVTGEVKPATQPTEKPQPQPGSSPIVDLSEITLAPVAKPGSAGVIKRESDVKELRLGKGGPVGPAIPTIGFLNTIPLWGWIVIGVVIGITSFLLDKLVFERREAGRIETTSPSNGEVKLSKKELLKGFEDKL